MARTVAVIGCLGLAVAASASGSTQRDALIRPGVGIGKVRLGMTVAQVQAAWGRPQAVTIEPHMRGGRTIDLQYDFGAYEVTLSGAPGTVFVSRMRRNSFLPEHWSGSAYVFEVVIRAPSS